MNYITKFQHDKFTDYVKQKYDLQVDDRVITDIPTFDTSLLNTFNWNIGLILGNSGSGKTTILKTLGEIKEPQYDYQKPVVSQFPKLKPEEVPELLCSVGLCDIPIWLHKPNELSNGERARLDICKTIHDSNGVVLIDEFTSVVNRSCAKSLSFALQKYVRRHNLQIILSSCHYDIAEWLTADWIFNLNNPQGIEHLNYNSSIYVPTDAILTDKRNVC